MNPSKSTFIFSLLLIVVLTFIAFYPSLSNGWTSWDDNIYVTDNPVVTDISFQNIKTVFTKVQDVTYAPVTMISYMIDYRIGGYDPFVYHATSLLFHILNSCLVFYFAYLFSGNIIAAVITGVLFGIHPMRVESVAWISGRKDVLSMFFFLLSSINYVLYVQRKKDSLLTISFLFFVLAILSKVIVLTFPLLMLLYDYQQRREFSSSVIVEKLPFVAVSGAFAVIGYFAQVSIHAVKRSANVLENMIVSLHGIVFYLEKLFLPLNLSNLYPFPGTIPWSYILYSLIFLVCCFLVWKVRSSETVIFGWLFFLISLLPVLQFIRFSRIFAADRFTYIAYIGLFYVAGMYGAKLWNEANKKIVIPVFLIFVFAFSMLTWQRCEVWKDGSTLWKDMLSKYPDPMQIR